MIPKGSNFYERDIAYKKGDNNNVFFGKIVNTEESFMDENEDIVKFNLLKNKMVEMAWISNGISEIVPEDHLFLYDRFLQKGDIVRRAENSQLGRCLDIHLTVSLRVVDTDRIISNINGDDLLPISHLCVYDVVLYEDWIGVVKKVDRETLVETSDKSEFILSNEDMLTLLEKDQEQKRTLAKPCYQYMGQVLLGSISIFADAYKRSISSNVEKILDAKAKHAKLRVQIKAFNVKSVEIAWVCSTYCKSEDEKMHGRPKDKIQKSDVNKVVKLNKYCLLDKYLGAHSHYLIKSEDFIQSSTKWKNQVDASLTSENESKAFEMEDSVFKERCATIQISNYSDNLTHHQTIAKEKVGILEQVVANENFGKRKRSIEKIESSKKLKLAQDEDQITEIFCISEDPGAIVSVEVVLCKTVVDVLWQDGSIENRISSCELTPLIHIDENEYFAGDFVIRNSIDLNLDVFGCIRKCNHKERTALITWVHYDSAQPGKPTLSTFIEEKCSVYDIQKEYEFRFQRGDTVIRTNIHEHHDCFANVGTVVHVQGPFHVSVNWLNGREELMRPQDLYYVDIIGVMDGISNAIGFEDLDSTCTSEGSDDSVNSLIDYSINKYDQTGDKDGIMRCLKKFVQNPMIEVSQIIDQFSSNPNIETISEFVNLFEFCRSCKNYTKLLLKCLKNYESIFGSKWMTFLDELKCINRHKIEIICNAICSYNDKDDKLNDEENDELKIMNGDANGRNAVFNQLESNALRSSLNCHIVCSTFEKQLFRYDHNYLCDINEFTEEIAMLAFFDNFKAQLEQNIAEKPRVKTRFHPFDIKDYKSEIFTLIDEVPSTHHYKTDFINHPPTFLNVIQKEFDILKSSLPPGFHIKGFTNRMDLFSVIIKGLPNTPYQDGLFLFDVQLPENYPKSPPSVFYNSFCKNRLNPNLFERGEVCISLLGTWSGKGTELWIPSKSNLYQLLLSIQGLILVAEPYYNEADYENQVRYLTNKENSRLYNEMALLKTIESMIAMIERPAEVFRGEILDHYRTIGPALIKRYTDYVTMMMSETIDPSDTIPSPGFPLLPASLGFFISFKRVLKELELAIDSI